MEVCPRQYFSIEKVSHMGCDIIMKTREHTVNHQPASSPKRIICPEPRRAVWVPHIIDTVNRKSCKPKSSLSSDRGDSHLDILNTILAKDELRDNSDESSNRWGFFGSPPVRTNNPLIHDVQFTQQNPSCSSPPNNFSGGSARSDRVSSCGTSPLGGKPMVRVEGFSCGGSKPSRIVHAFG